MRNLTEIYLGSNDVRESEIPEIWKESFNNFIFGQTCLADVNDDGSVKEFIYYLSDFRRWYFINKKEIERDVKIDSIL